MNLRDKTRLTGPYSLVIQDNVFLCWLCFPGNRAEAGMLPPHSPNAGFHFVDLHDSICFSGSKVQKGKAPAERRARAAHTNNWVLALENSTCLFACIQTAGLLEHPTENELRRGMTLQTFQSPGVTQTGARKNILLFKRESLYSAWWNLLYRIRRENSTQLFEEHIQM